MRKILLMAALCLASTTIYAQQFGAALTAGDGVIFAGEGGNRVSAGTVYVYTRAEDGSWMETGKLKAPGSSDEANGFGRALSVDGNTLVVGAPTESAAYVFEKGEDGTWANVARLEGFGVGLGSAVAISEDQILVGSIGEGTEESAAVNHIWTRQEDGSWAMTGHLASRSIALQQNGVQVAIHGDLALVGAPMANERAGAVVVFQKGEDGSWSEIQSLTMPVAAANQLFGSSMFLHNGRAVIGAPGYENRIGGVGVFHFNDETNTLDFTLRLSPTTASGNEMFGASQVHDPSHTLWVGAPGANNREGAAYMFKPADMMRAFSAKGEVDVQALQIRSSFGNAMAVGADFVVVGASGYDNGEGAAIVYNQTESGWEQSTTILHDNGAMDSFAGEMVECEEGNAAGFRCDNVDVQSFLSLRDIGGVRGTRMNDIWGWTHEDSGRDFALVGRTDGAAFVEVSDPYNPVYLGNLAKTEGATNSVWRDIKVYKDHAYIVADGAGQHGMQVFDLHRLLDVPDAPVEFDADVMYDQIASAHNIVINEETGFAYSVASRMGGITCGGGLHMIDIRDPKNPEFAGCFSHEGTGRNGTGNTHDAQCIIYRGPDGEHNGKEICLGSNETALSIADVTDKSNPTAISRATYPAIAYTHQGWLTEDQRYFYINDEGDEPQGLVDGTRTLIFDLEDLDDPILVGEHISTEVSTDHNLYIKGNLMYQSNYVAGLRILDVSNPEAPEEVAFFDTVSDDRTGGGSWSNYPYFRNGTIIVTSSREGLFMLKKREVDL
ncbi:MAG: choice-of-anchor B family protein [Bacteroidetes Order II. Incertae sedis bacterium]|nr:choice-of-anchor B family protein [Bacteroidetes Order II. bacterium]MBT4603167.1 choice-of-anchor B family protein [Bacteroidetes Order II. bacterium]MBT5250213.1 choice-of-anchor B family protein [Bacteroidetes Order II. bacterium]